MNTYRLPLKDLSNSNVNKLGKTNDTKLLLLSTGSKLNESLSLPPIKSLISPSFMEVPIHESGLTFVPPAVPMTHSFSVTKKPIEVDNLVKRDRSIDLENTIASRRDMSKKLQVRLQFAYYKYTTNQIDIKFKDMKEKYNVHTNSYDYYRNNDYSSVLRTTPKRSTKRRKLLVSQGNYKTPAKSVYTVSGTNSLSIDISSESSISHLTPSVTYSASNKHISTGATTSYLSNNITVEQYSLNETTIFTTPSSNSTNKILMNNGKGQETPMSVKAANSLISLFTSNRR